MLVPRHGDWRVRAIRRARLVIRAEIPMRLRSTSFHSGAERSSGHSDRTLCCASPVIQPYVYLNCVSQECHPHGCLIRLFCGHSQPPPKQVLFCFPCPSPPSLERRLSPSRHSDSCQTLPARLAYSFTTEAWSAWTSPDVHFRLRSSPSRHLIKACGSHSTEQ